MKFRTSKISLYNLIIIALCLISANVILINCKNLRPMPYYKQQITAADMMIDCIESLDSLSACTPVDTITNDYPILIGEEYTPTTTTLGNLKAKLTTLNPDFAALLIRWFINLNLMPSDRIAIGCSGSFPALVFAAISAAEVLKIDPVIISSLGASSYGANRPELTYLDMEQCLYQQDIIHHRSKAVSLGGYKDLALDLEDEGRQLLLQAVNRNRIQYIHEEEIEINIEKRSEIFEQYGVPKVFINIGGAEINIGDYNSFKKFLPGLNYANGHSDYKINSMMSYFANQGIPIINFLNIEFIANQYAIDTTTMKQHEPGYSRVYYDEFIAIKIWIIVIILFIFGIGLLLKSEKLGTQKAQKNKEHSNIKI